MITDITIHNVASFENVKLTNLQRLNFIYGSNGTGKTTISRVIADVSHYPDCHVQWEGNAELETLVYNKDFIDHNFNVQETIQGVFTLGEQQVETERQIESVKQEIRQLDELITNFTGTLEGKDDEIGKKEELRNLLEKYRDIFWEQKVKHSAKLGGGLEGYRNDKKLFMQKVLEEAGSNQALLLSQSDLEAKAEIVFADNQTEQQKFSAISFDILIECEEDAVLQKQIIGKADVDISAMIEKLQNSDWVSQGWNYYKDNNGICPFCQQSTTDGLERSLSEYFDDSYAKDIQALMDIIVSYQSNSQTVLRAIQALIELESPFLDNNTLKTQMGILQTRLDANKHTLDRKKKEASKKVQVEPVKQLLTGINDIIETANEKIEIHNQTLKDIKHEQTTLKLHIWRFIIEELNSDIITYNDEKAKIDKAIGTLENKIKEKKEEREMKNNELQLLEKQITSIRPTKDAINNLLASFGFTGFQLRECEGNRYTLVRQNGDDAQYSLSEGEKNFITFLYFYHLLAGSQSESGINMPRIVVFDDPVSSLDNDILFIVSNLICNLYKDVSEGTKNIKQLFLLTHNVYFHKQVSYKQLGNYIRFFSVKKIDDKSIVTSHNENPIKSSYELLWSEVRDKDRSKSTLRITMRRILENYFKLLGSVSLNELPNKFEGNDKCICSSLISWAHDGAHYASFDNVVYSELSDTTVEKYLQIFKEIFEKCGHIAHYNMMMGFSPEPA